jgi:hypothetical protein
MARRAISLTHSQTPSDVPRRALVMPHYIHILRQLINCTDMKDFSGGCESVLNRYRNMKVISYLLVQLQLDRFAFGSLRRMLWYFSQLRLGIYQTNVGRMQAVGFKNRC